MPAEPGQLVGLYVDYVLDGRAWGMGVVEQYKRGRVTEVQQGQVTIAWCIKCPKTIERVTQLAFPRFVEQVEEGRLTLHEKARTRKVRG